MWELYTFWAFVPLLLATHARLHPGQSGYGRGWAFGLIAAGAPACVLGGYLARRWGSLPTARLSLAISGSCCVLSPWLLALPRPAFVGGVLVWGMAVVADSPQFSTLVARPGRGHGHGAHVGYLRRLCAHRCELAGVCGGAGLAAAALGVLGAGTGAAVGTARHLGPAGGSSLPAQFCLILQP